MSSPTPQTVAEVMQILHRTYPDHPMHEAFHHNAFQMLVAVVLSQRATDAMTIPVAQQLFAIAPTPEAIVDMPLPALENAIKKIGFFHAKALALRKLSMAILEKHGGHVPSTEAELLALPQVGRKTANIMLTKFFNTPQIAVDVHVHRITNRMGWIATKTPEETEIELTKIIPKDFIPITNQVFVRHGQITCKPTSPLCSHCPIYAYCERRGVTHQR